MHTSTKNSKYFRNVIIAMFGIWLVILFLLRNFIFSEKPGFNYGDNFGNNKRVEFFIIYVILIIVFYQVLNLIDRKFFLNKYSYEKKFVVKTIFIFIFGIPLIFAINYLLNHVDYNTLTPNILRFQLWGAVINPLILFLMYFSDFEKNAIRIELENEKLLSQNLSVQLQLLKQQIKPHFLFNSLNHLLSLVREKDQNTEQFVVHLSELYRNLLQTDLKDKILLNEELDIINSYFYMLKTRFEDNIDLTIKINKSLYSSFIPPFTLQVLIENCVKHNVVSESKPLHICIFDRDNSLIIENKLQEKKFTEESNNVGLANLNQRYLLISGRPIEIIKTNDKFRVILPILN